MINGVGLMRLRYIYTANFQKTEVTLLDEALKEAELELKKGDCVLLVSMSRKILKFVFGKRQLGEVIGSQGKTYAGHFTTVVESKTYRIVDGGTFNPMMLQNYANELGIELAHIKRFEEHLKAELREELRSAA